MLAKIRRLTTRKLNTILTAISVTLSLGYPYPSEAAGRITVAVALFDGPGAIGQSVSTVIRLQFWATLTSSGGDGSSGAVIWAKDPLRSQTYEAAERYAKQIGILAQFVVFGKVYPYAQDAILHSYLAIPDYTDFRPNRNEAWKIIITTATNRAATFTADIPQRRYAFEPIVISREIVEKYIGRDSVKIFDAPVNGTQIGVVGDNTKLLEIKPGVIRVVSGKLRGWVPVSDFNQSNNAIEFTSGLIRLFRGDLNSAFKHFRSVSDNALTPNEIRIDALLYQALVLNRQGRDGGEQLAEAKRLNPLAKRTAVYLIMAELEKLQKAYRHGSPALRNTALRQVQLAVDEKRRLFSDDDPWLSQVRTGLQLLLESP
jgi:hypothetical protein